MNLTNLKLKLGKKNDALVENKNTEVHRDSMTPGQDAPSFISPAKEAVILPPIKSAEQYQTPVSDNKHQITDMVNNMMIKHKKE